MRVTNQLGIILVVTILLYSCNADLPQIKSHPVFLNSAIDILPINDSCVIPVDYLNATSLKNLGILDRKQKFIELMLPLILIVKYRFDFDLNQVEMIALKDSSKLKRHEKQLLERLFIKFKTKNIEELQLRLKTHPVSIALAQAAVESAWGTSRIFISANNPFGIWSFDENEPRIKAYGTREGMAVFLRKFSSLSEAVEEYFITLACGPYPDFRLKRMESHDVITLLQDLHPYSEMGAEYIQQLRLVINRNNLTQYDQYRIHPDYIRP